ncbi:MAG: hypothetical protein SGBAC_011159, partial [Bacillariaceae sp.]
MEDSYDECKERRDAELEFVESAYAPEEAFCEREDDTKPPIIIRKLMLLDEESSGSGDQQSSVVMLSMRLALPLDYPGHSPLQVELSIDQDGSSAATNLMKAALNAIPSLNETCRSIAMEHQEEESVFLVFSQADEWIQDEWPNLWKEYRQNQGGGRSNKNSGSPTSRDKKQPSKNLVLGRRLIYSHHIISKVKRADMKSLASQYKLTGYMKIGWPGLLILEGLEEDCIAFYDEIRPWNWQYLVLRGEQQEILPAKGNGSDEDDDVLLKSHRKFELFLEVEDMSLVAQHCRQVGLENLFRTAMKVYDNSADANEGGGDEGRRSKYGVLVHVDHMNNPKGYRKWLRRTSQETDCKILIKQSYPNHDYNRRPKIVVGIVGDSRDQ